MMKQLEGRRIVAVHTEGLVLSRKDAATIEVVGATPHVRQGPGPELLPGRVVFTAELADGQLRHRVWEEDLPRSESVNRYPWPPGRDVATPGPMLELGSERFAVFLNIDRIIGNTVERVTVGRPSGLHRSLGTLVEICSTTNPAWRGWLMTAEIVLAHPLGEGVRHGPPHPDGFWNGCRLGPTAALVAGRCLVHDDCVDNRDLGIACGASPR